VSISAMKNGMLQRQENFTRCLHLKIAKHQVSIFECDKFTFVLFILASVIKCEQYTQMPHYTLEEVNFKINLL